MKEFKRRTYKISKISILSCVVATSIMISNVVGVKALDADNVMLSNDKKPMQISTDYKSFGNISLKSQISLNNIENTLIKAKKVDFLPKRSSSKSFLLN